MTKKQQNKKSNYSTFAGIIYPSHLHVTSAIYKMAECYKHYSFSREEFYITENIQFMIGNNRFYHCESETIIGIDGEITNTAELIYELENYGYSFTEKSYGEVVAKAYKYWKSTFISKLEGSFSIVIYDPNKKELILAKDKIGHRSLYWSLHQGYFVFATELKPFINTGIIPIQVSYEGLSSYLNLGFFPQDITPFEQINKILPSHHLTYSSKAGVKIMSYWSLSAAFKVNYNHFTGGKVLEIIENHLNEYKTFSKDEICLACNFESLVLLPYLPNISRPFFSELNLSNVFEKLPNLIWQLEEPLAFPNIVIQWINFRSNFDNSSIKYFLSGAGFKELLQLNGPNFKTSSIKTFLQKRKEQITILFTKRILKFSHLLPRNTSLYLLRKQLLSAIELKINESYFIDEFPLNKASLILSKEFNKEIFIYKFHHLDRIKSVFSRSVYLNLKTKIPDLHLLFLEKLARFYNVDTLTPFLDRSIIELLISSNICDEKHAENIYKHFSKSIPDEFKTYTDQQFIGKWRNDKNYKKVCEKLLKGHLVESGLISSSWLKKQLHNIRYSFHQLWAILVLEIWFKIFVTNPLTTSLPNKSVKELLE
ncbi:MAG: hypothetical protein BGO10_08950 [Chlamydia sp. 32-24]|nr:MAG: hypothetical protein BGO10_08950 [Chlamydia sp. 32-24]